MAKMQTPPAAWIEAGLRALGKGGPEAVRVEVLARSLGVTKGSFYWSFEDRPALMEAILDRWEAGTVEEVMSRVEAEGEGPSAKLRLLFSVARGEDLRDLVRAELAIRNWARHEESVRKRLRRVDGRRMDYMRALFAAAGAEEAVAEARSLIVFSLFVGSPFVAVEHPGMSRAEVIDAALEDLLR